LVIKSVTKFVSNIFGTNLIQRTLSPEAMEHERYNLVKYEDRAFYEFYSIGPQGKIKKVIGFRPLKNFGTNVYNLAFGDWNETEGAINDKIVSNNKDKQKVLFTVAAAAFDFLQSKPEAIILIMGSTVSRTRLYQMAIASYWPMIEQKFEIPGEYEGEWLPFQKGINYKRFLLFRKII
jgi:hypothetical protein